MYFSHELFPQLSSFLPFLSFHSSEENRLRGNLFSSSRLWKKGCEKWVSLGKKNKKKKNSILGISITLSINLPYFQGI